MCNPVLNQHLCDTFSAKVLELNETAFTLTDDDDGVQANEDHEVCRTLQKHAHTIHRFFLLLEKKKIFSRIFLIILFLLKTIYVRLEKQVYPCIPQVCCIKVGYRDYILLHGHVILIKLHFLLLSRDI